MSVYHIGLQYDSKILPMKIDGEARTKRISQVIATFNNTLGGKFGEDYDNLDTITFRESNDDMNDSPSLFTGHKELPLDSTHNKRGDIWIKQEQQLPMRLLGLALKLEDFNG